MKKYIRIVLVPLIFLLTAPLLLSIINLFDIEISKIIYLIGIIIMTIITGIFLGTITDKKAYLKGLVLGFCLSLFMFLASLILRSSFSIYTLVYYLIIIVSAMMGSIIGISKKDK